MRSVPRSERSPDGFAYLAASPDTVVRTLAVSPEPAYARGMRNVPAVILATITFAACGLAASAPVSAHSDATGCRVFAEIPQVPAKLAAHAQLYAWAEVHCATTTNVTVRVCALNVGSGPVELPSKPVWCQQSSITARAGHRAFAKTVPHNCTVGSRYVSFVSLNGLTTDRGPWEFCRLAP
jgi:hypothetical protein